MKKHKHSANHKKPKNMIGFMVLGFSSFFWLVFRSGKKPSRLQYPCQKIAASNSIAFFAWLVSVFGGHFFYKKLKSQLTWARVGVVAGLVLLVFLGVRYYQAWERSLRPREIWGQSSKSRVVWITDHGATNGYNQPWSNKANQSVVNDMMDKAMKALTGENSVESAWTKIFTDHNEGSDYSSGEKIAIKANFNNSTSCQDHSSGCPLYQVVNALLRHLVDVKGISQANIAVYDTSRSFFSDFSSGVSNAYPSVQLNSDRDTGNEGVTVPGGTAYFSRLLAEAKYLINMPLLRTHGQPGATLSFKNHLGSTGPESTECPGPRCFHGNFLDKSSSTNSLVILNKHPYIKDKTILVVDDALYGLTSGGPGGVPDLESSSLFLSTDPVAVDSVMIDYLESVRGKGWGSIDPRIAYEAGASIGLGNFGNSCNNGSCSFSYSNIDLVKCEPNCPGTSPAPSPSPSPSPSPDPLEDVLKVLTNWGDGGGEGDFYSDGKVNGIDFGEVIKNWD